MLHAVELDVADPAWHHRVRPSACGRVPGHWPQLVEPQVTVSAGGRLQRVLHAMRASARRRHADARQAGPRCSSSCHQQVPRPCGHVPVVGAGDLEVVGLVTQLAEGFDDAGQVELPRRIRHHDLRLLPHDARDQLLDLEALRVEGQGAHDPVGFPGPWRSYAAPELLPGAAVCAQRAAELDALVVLEGQAARHRRRLAQRSVSQGGLGHGAFLARYPEEVLLRFSQHLPPSLGWLDAVPSFAKQRGVDLFHFFTCEPVRHVIVVGPHEQRRGAEAVEYLQALHEPDHVACQGVARAAFCKPRLDILIVRYVIDKFSTPLPTTLCGQGHEGQ